MAWDETALLTLSSARNPTLPHGPELSQKPSLPAVCLSVCDINNSSNDLLPKATVRIRVPLEPQSGNLSVETYKRGWTTAKTFDNHETKLTELWQDYALQSWVSITEGKGA